MPKYIKPHVEFVTSTPHPERLIARMARICYQSDKGNDSKLIEHIIKNGHTSQIEHATASFIVTHDRGVTHEIVRSRIGVAYSQESTRYCNYAQEKFESEIKIIDPPGLTDEQRARRTTVYKAMEDLYIKEVQEGVTPQIARGILPTSLKTQIGITMDFRAWRWFLALRTSDKAHPQIRELAFPIWQRLIKLAPTVFRTIPSVPENGQINENVCLTMPEVLATLSDAEWA